MALREAKDTAEKEAMYWKEKNAKQQEAAQQEMDHFRKEQVQRLQEHHDNWEGRMKEMQAQITSQEQEKKQLREKSNRLENDLHQVIEDLARCKEYAMQLERENAHQQQEKVKYGEEEMWLREQIHTKDAQLEEVRLYNEEIEKMKASEEEEITRLILRDIQNQEELATLRSSKEDARCLIRERDTLQEEVDKLKKEETTRKEKMARLRGERDDYRMKLNELENTVTSLSRNLSEKVSACQREIAELKSKEATLHEEATQLRRERDLYRDEAKERENSYIDKINELKWSENKITELQQERDNLKGEVDQLKQATSTEIRKERDSYKEETKRLSKELSALEYKMKVVGRERDSYKEEADGLKTREEQFNQMTERDLNRRMEESRMAQMELKIQNYKTKIVELEGKNNTLKKQMEREKENHQQKVDAETSRLRKENERVGGYRRREETLGKQIEEMATEREDLIQQLLRERDEVQKLERRENAREKQLTETITDRDMYKRERDEYKQTADKLMRNNFTLTTERDCCISEREQERGKHKEEVERLKRTHNNEMRLREERDRYKREVQRLKEELEVASGAATTRHTEVIWPKKDLEDIPPPPAPSHGAEDIEMVTVGLRRKEEEDEEEVATLGLPNLGNSCYINGVVQCLYHLPPLRNTLAQCTDLQYQDQPGMGVAHALAQLFGTMKSGDNSVIRFPLRELKQVLGSHDEAFGGKRQQEAHDLFSAIATWLHSDLRQYDAPDTSHGSSLFEGWLETRMVCPEQGKTLAPNKEAFTSISLPVVGVNTWSLKALLDKHFRTQTLKWDCDSCCYPHQCDHLTHLLTCPHVFVIHFSRVRDSKTRRKTKVDFPVSELSLQKYMVSDSPRSPTYKLVGVVCHHGSMGGGHYTAYCRYGKGPWGNRWRFCNDDRVWDVDERQVLSDENAHLLFYIQQ
ncbi:golgin subfamily A member 6-like protein 22 isoform X3 [Eriocheir sinensis]|uniref:golgin subfamily A member 6-like protein 22 isoform X3 n=1 Tax=Eriocheir sinensis TaxID=95602 RepID=UPI0021C67E0D|nr:golgin subfamily A member 6-like protein 22 isoform X3 [Eriocheir sinensis]